MSFHKVTVQDPYYSGQSLKDIIRRIRSAVGNVLIDYQTNTFQQQGRPVNIQAFGGMDLNKLYKSCTPERHWESIIVNAECVGEYILDPTTLLLNNHTSLLGRSSRPLLKLLESPSGQGL